MVSNVSGHWTDEQLIEYLYGVGPQDGHLAGCRFCQARVSSLHVRRRTMELSASPDREIGFEFLAAQRRKIYAKLTAPTHWWSFLQARRWTSATATLVLLGSGLLLYEENHKQQSIQDKVSDAQLAREVSSMAADPEPEPTAPLQALFEE